MKDVNGAYVNAKLAHERLHHIGPNGKPQPLCLACGAKATNELPSCNEPKCVKLVRPVYRWARQVAALTLTKGVKVKAA